MGERGQHRVGDVFKAHRLWYHSTLGLRAIKKKKVGDVRAFTRAHAQTHDAPRGSTYIMSRARMHMMSRDAETHNAALCADT